MQQKRRLIVCEIRWREILVVDAQGETVSESEPVSSSRLRKALPASPEDEPSTPEFRELREWTRGAELARRAS